LNSSLERLSLKKGDERREQDLSGQYALVRVAEFNATLKDENGDAILDADGKEQYTGVKFTRNQIEEVGTYDEIAEMAYADDMLEAMRQDFVAARVEQMRVARKARTIATPVVVKADGVANTEPVIGG
jgi:hypothetical protein